MELDGCRRELALHDSNLDALTSEKNSEIDEVISNKSRLIDVKDSKIKEIQAELDEEISLKE